MSSEPTPVAAARAMPPTRRKRLLIAGAALLVLLLGWALRAWWSGGREGTDDAQIEADVVAVAPRIPGLIQKVLVKENQLVKRGEVLLELDQADLQARVQLAEAELESANAQAAVVEAGARGGLSSARAGVSASAAGLAGAAAQVDGARASVARAEADARRADADFKRMEELRGAQAVSQERFEAALAGRDGAVAALAAARAQLAGATEGRRTAEGRVAEAGGRLETSAPIDAQIAAAHARVKGAQAQLDLARNQRDYARVTAPADGLVSRLAAREGALVVAGQVLGQLVPTRAYVVANFKETQLARIRPGQAAEVAVDAFPGAVLHAKVESISGGTGARFSLLPPDNASGNFVKVVERIPVRLELVDPPADLALRAGLSADVTIRVR
jgi:membrane fusion protein (multidrug efflux system)